MAGLPWCFHGGMMTYRYRSGVVAAIDSTQFVMPGLVSGIHVFKTARMEDVDGRT
jgi:hypothetical protein